MMMKKIKSIIVFVLFMLFICSNAFAFQFEGFNWGTSQKEIVERLKNDSKQVMEQWETVAYMDRIFGEGCGVVLTFTQKTNLLFRVTITWGNKDIGKKIRELLAKKHGKPYQSGDRAMYVWKGASPYDNIVLDYSGFDIPGTILYYNGGKFLEKAIEEQGPHTVIRGENYEYWP